MLQATVDSLLPDWPAMSAVDRAAVSRHCMDFVHRQISLAPAHIRLGFWVLVTIFVMFAALRAIARGSMPGKPDPAALAKFASLGPVAFASLERVLRSMTLLAFLEHPAVLSAIGKDDSGP